MGILRGALLTGPGGDVNVIYFFPTGAPAAVAVNVFAGHYRYLLAHVASCVVTF